MQTFPWPHPSMAPASYHTAGALPAFSPSLLSLVLGPFPHDLELSEENRNHARYFVHGRVFFNMVHNLHSMKYINVKCAI